jgi:beta-glucosidase
MEGEPKKLPDFYKKSKEEKFDFSAEKVIETLKSPNGEKMKYIGTAMSDFQTEPIVYGKDGKKIILSDWEMAIEKNLQGDKRYIPLAQDEKDFPQFFKNKESHLKRTEEMNQNMFRMSLDFARLCPKEGEFDSKLMEEYVRALALIKAHGQEPMLTMYHWPMPNYLIKTDQKGDIVAGGWENPDVAKHFRFYVENVINFLTDDQKIKNALEKEGLDKDSQDKFLSEGMVNYFLTINEPNSILLPGYLAGVFPPYKKMRIDLMPKILDRLVQAQDIAYNKIKEKIKDSKVGIAHSWPDFDGMLGKVAHEIINGHVTDKFERDGAYSDFLGMQYYYRMTLSPSIDKSKRLYEEHPDFGDVYPPGMLDMLKKMNNRYPNKEIFITEFGFSDSTDKQKPYLILETMRYVIEALKSGIPIKGMLLWTLINNFEWAEGMQQGFGIFKKEKDLLTPLNPSKSGSIQTWEVWKAVATAISNPNQKTLQVLQKQYEIAKSQFEMSLPKKLI